MIIPFLLGGNRLGSATHCSDVVGGGEDGETDRGGGVWTSPCTRGGAEVIEGTAVGFLRMKLSIDPSFGFEAAISRFAFLSRHIFVPRCRFSMLAAPPGPQLRRAPQSGHVA
jgi:hypothetical protein